MDFTIHVAKVKADMRLYFRIQLDAKSSFFYHNHFVNVSVLIKFSQKTSVFTFIIISSIKSCFGCVLESPR